MNLLLTTTCNRRCEYCFAAEYVERDAEDLQEDERFISLRHFVEAIDFFVASNERRVSLLGGEPTLHPLFNNFVRYILKRNLDVQVFTNGIMPEAACEELAARIIPDRVAFTVNINPPSLRTTREDALVRNFLASLGPACTPGININKPGLDLDFVIEHIEEFKLRRVVRVGISHPTRNRETRHLQIEEYPSVLKQVVHFARRLEEKEIQISLDCGFPLCLFTDEDLGLLARNSPARKQISSCQSAIDIGVDGTAWKCFPLQSLGAVPIHRFANVQELFQFFGALERQSRPDRPGGIFSECQECVFQRRNQCGSGCQGYSLFGSKDKPSKETIINAS